MQIQVIVKPNARQIGVEEIGERKYRVAVHEPAQQNKANRAMIQALAEYFNVAQIQIECVRGKTSKIKIVKVKGL